MSAYGNLSKNDSQFDELDTDQHSQFDELDTDQHTG